MQVKKPRLPQMFNPVRLPTKTLSFRVALDIKSYVIIGVKGLSPTSVSTSGRKFSLYSKVDGKKNSTISRRAFSVILKNKRFSKPSRCCLRQSLQPSSRFQMNIYHYKNAQSEMDLRVAKKGSAETNSMLAALTEKKLPRTW